MRNLGFLAEFLEFYFTLYSIALFVVHSLFMTGSPNAILPASGEPTLKREWIMGNFCDRKLAKKK